MNWQRIATLGVMGGTLVTLLARASTSGVPSPAPLPAGATPRPTAPVFPDVARLRQRLRAPIVPAAPTRNLFTFARTGRPPAAGPPAADARAAAADVAPPAVAAPPAPPLTFVGLAEDPGPAGPVRTAILSSGHDLHFARIGDVIGAYRVSAIGLDAVELIDTGDGSSLVLALE